MESMILGEYDPFLVNSQRSKLYHMVGVGLNTPKSICYLVIVHFSGYGSHDGGHIEGLQGRRTIHLTLGSATVGSWYVSRKNSPSVNN